MDKFLTQFLVKEIKFGKKTSLAPLDILLLLGITFAGVMLRLCVAGYSFIPEESELYAGYMELATGLKVTGCIFDLALAVLLALMVYQFTGHKIKSFFAYGITWVLPVLVSGSVMWGMADSVYLFFALLSMKLLFEKKGGMALFIYGISLFFNWSALFLLPVYLLLYLEGKFSFAGFLSPVVFGVLKGVMTYGNLNIRIPMFEAEEMLMLQRGEKLLSYSCPNVFFIIGPDKFVTEYEKVALAFTVGLTIMLLVLLLTKKVAWDHVKILELSLFFSIFIPFTAPGMNERSLVPACILALVYGFVNLGKFYLPIVLTTIAYISYSAYFRGESAVPLTGVAFLVLALLVYLLRSNMKKWNM